MKTLALLTLLLIMNGCAVGQMMKSEEGFVGQDVLLSCNCSNDPKELIWQKGERVVNVHPHDKSIIDDSYVNRTQLFLNKEKRNCSLLLRNVSSTDAGLYTSHAIVSVGDKVWSRSTLEVNLTVSEMKNSPETKGQTGGSSVTAVSISVPILVVALILAASLLLTLLIRRRHRPNTDTELQAGRPMLENTNAV